LSFAHFIGEYLRRYISPATAEAPYPTRINFYRRIVMTPINHQEYFHPRFLPDFVKPPKLLHYLASRNFALTEGEIMDAQIKSIQAAVNGIASGSRCLEIGFNCGLSAATILSSRDDVSLVSVDIGEHPTVLLAKPIIDKVFPDRHTLIVGSSLDLIPRLGQAYNMKFDFIFIDGGHTHPVPYMDIVNCIKLAADDALICIDDWCEVFGAGGVNQAISEFMGNGTLRCLEENTAKGHLYDHGWGFFKINR